MTQPFVWHPATRILGDAPAIAALRGAVMAGLALRVAGGQVTGFAADAPVLLCETSGSAGVPKVICRTPASWQASFAINGPLLGLAPERTVAVFAGPASSLALYAMLEAAHHGATIQALQDLRPDRQAAALGQAGTQVLYLTPTQLGQLCGADRTLPAVRHIMVGGGQLSQAIQAAAARICPAARLIQFYGAAETSFITWTDAATPPGAVGRPYPGVTLRLDDAGTIWVRSPYLSDGYASGISAETRWHDGFLTVGERGHLDSDGHLYLAGRHSRMVTVADHNVHPEAVEAVLADLVEARTIAVVALPDAARGARLVALIAGAAPGTTPAAVRRACRNRLAPQAVPHRIHLLDDLPLLPAGKPDYTAITALARDLA